MSLVVYLSAVLDPVAVILPGCLKPVAAVFVATEQSEGIVKGHTSTIYVPHSVEIL